MRMILWRWLRDHRFGYLQDSVWVRPHPAAHLLQSLTWFQDNPEMFVVLEARRLAGGSDHAIVNGAWDFDFLQDRYRQHLDAVADAQRSLMKEIALPALSALIRRERRFYADALRHDPLLPRRLWPAGYLGPACWNARNALLAAARQHFETRLAVK
jgi:DNA-binding transcriptional regulator PaaX